MRFVDCPTPFPSVSAQRGQHYGGRVIWLSMGSKNESRSRLYEMMRGAAAKTTKAPDQIPKSDLKAAAERGTGTPGRPFSKPERRTRGVSA
jgi:hypothetical protein